MPDWTTPRTWSGDARDRQIRDNLKYLHDNLSPLHTGSYTDYDEIAAPDPPDADTARLYAADDAGTTKLYYKRSDGTEVEVGGGGQTDSWRADRVVDLGGDGTDTSIQTAITTLGATGGVIFIMPGTYDENLTLPAGVADLRLIGAGRDNVIIRGTDGTVLAASGNSDDVELRDLTIQHLNVRPTDQLVYLYDASWSMNRVRFVNVKFDSGYDAVYLRTGVGHVVERCWFLDQANRALYINASDWIVVNNRMENSGQYGMELAGDHGRCVSNYIYNTTDDGIHLASTLSDTVIADNVIEDPGDFGIGCPVTSGINRLTIRGNLIDTPTDYGMYLYNGGQLVVTGNIIENGSSRGMDIRGIANSIFANNQIYSCGAEGIYVRGGGDKCTFSGNVIVDNTGDGFEVEAASASIDCVLVGNVIQGNGVYGVDLGSTANQYNWIIMSNVLTGNTSGAIQNHGGSANIYETAASDPYNVV
jgi:parallel beta-helix repeat protein